MRKLLCTAALCGLAALSPVVAPLSHAQATSPSSVSAPLPAAWSQLGVTKVPEATPLLGLAFPDIVLGGPVALELRSKLQFTQRLVLLAAPPGAPEQATVLQTIVVDAKSPRAHRFTQAFTQTKMLTLLAQTPEGWFMVQRQLNVGRKP